MTRQPRAFRLDDPEVKSGSVVVTEDPFDAIEAADGTLVPMGERRRAPWFGILLSALSGLLLLGLGLAVENLIVDLYAVAPWLGWVALVLSALALLAFLAIVGREVGGIWREQKIENLREAAVDALAVKDHKAAKAIVSDLLGLYNTRASAVKGSARLMASMDEIIDADDRLAIAERELLAPLDAQAKRAIAAAAKQVSLVTAVSPRAIVDVAFVVFAAVRLLRTLARIYGGRPGTFGFLRLAKAAFNHLAVTGGVAVGDSLMQQVLGLGLAARVSAKLGEGVLNGLMTARFGLAALSVCRPLPFVREEPPKIGDVAGELVSRAEQAATT
ncbi:YcjF family protein [Microvirga sp. GCM10011540]|uniref:YcjF family protein n=1 Tax=Microvirga sp. GCM10011540 TaxID=3317338 RepID=UPI00362232A2